MGKNKKALRAPSKEGHSAKFGSKEKSKVSEGLVRLKGAAATGSPKTPHGPRSLAKATSYINCDCLRNRKEKCELEREKMLAIRTTRVYPRVHCPDLNDCAQRRGKITEVYVRCQSFKRASLVHKLEKLG